MTTGPEISGGGLSLSAGNGFAPYATNDPMSRRGLPNNHYSRGSSSAGSCMESGVSRDRA